MRVTQSMLYNNFLSNLNNINSQLYNTQTQMATGKSINNLSDNPIALSQVLSLNDIQSRLTQYTSNINSANSVLSAQDTATSNISTLLQNSGSLIIQAANATNDSASNASIAQQLQAIEAEIKNSANTMFGGQYLFSGFLTNTAPIQDTTPQVATTSTTNNNIQIKTSNNFGDINLLNSGSYSIQIDGNGNLSISQNGIAIPISVDGVDRSSAGGDQLSTSVNVSNLLQNGGWFNTGRGISIYIPKNSQSSTVTFSYIKGSANTYTGDNNNESIAYSDGLSTPITINANNLLYQQNQTITSNNQLLNVSNDPATNQTKLTDLHLNNALANISLQSGYTIIAKGTDHSGNIVSGSFTVSAGATVSSLLNFINNLSSKEVLQNNKVLTLADGSIASSLTTIGQLTGGSGITVNGLAHSSGATISLNVSAGTTLGSFLNLVNVNFNVSATISHGLIQIDDNQTGPSKLSINIQTQTNKNPVFGMFNTISDGSSGGFVSTVSATIQNGHIVVTDLRGGNSQMNLSLSIANNNTPEPNIFGVFNTTTLGGGVDVFRSFDNAQAAITGSQVNQISQATNWNGGSTLQPTLSGYYSGNTSDTWTITVTSGVSANITSSAHVLTITNSQGNFVGQITITPQTTSGNTTYNINVVDSQGNNVYSVNNQSNLDNIQLPDGVVLNLNQSGNLTKVLNQGDSFSFKLTNMLQQSITNIQNSLGQVDANRSIIGAYEQRMQLAQTRIENLSLSNAQAISNLQDANYAQVIGDYEREITIMQALLQSFAKVNQLSLFNYI